LSDACQQHQVLESYDGMTELIGFIANPDSHLRNLVSVESRQRACLKTRTSSPSVDLHGDIKNIGKDALDGVKEDENVFEMTNKVCRSLDLQVWRQSPFGALESPRCDRSTQAMGTPATPSNASRAAFDLLRCEPCSIAAGRAMLSVLKDTIDL
jgi:hypothetical protein